VNAFYRTLNCVCSLSLLSGVSNRVRYGRLVHPKVLDFERVILVIGVCRRGRSVHCRVKI